MSDLAILVLALAIVAHALILKGRKMSALDDKISELKDAVAADSTVHGSATALITGFAQRMADGIAAALAAGATQDQLQSLSDTISAIKAGSSGLADAVAANTPAAPATTDPANPS
jgi:hypothetical protein